MSFSENFDLAQTARTHSKRHFIGSRTQFKYSRLKDFRFFKKKIVPPVTEGGHPASVGRRRQELNITHRSPVAGHNLTKS